MTELKLEDFQRLAGELCSQMDSVKRGGEMADIEQIKQEVGRIVHTRNQQLEARMNSLVAVEMANVQDVGVSLDRFIRELRECLNVNHSRLEKRLVTAIGANSAPVAIEPVDPVLEMEHKKEMAIIESKSKLLTKVVPGVVAGTMFFVGAALGGVMAWLAA